MEAWLRDLGPTPPSSAASTPCSCARWPFLGRLLARSDDTTPGVHPVVVLSHGTWTRKFGGRATVIGERIVVNATPFEIVGVAPPGFTGATLGVEPELWASMAMNAALRRDENWYGQRRGLSLSALARLRPGVDLEAARAALQTLGARLEQAWPADNEGRGLTLLAFAGALLGLLVARWAGHALLAFVSGLPAQVTLSLDLGLDPRALVFTMGVAALTAVLAGLAPAWPVARPELVTALKDRGTGETRGGRLGSARHLLVGAQVALSLVALVGAGLFTRSLDAAQRVDAGFDSERLGLVSFDLGLQGYDRERGLVFLRTVLERVGAIPGVARATLAHAGPLLGAIAALALSRLVAALLFVSPSDPLVHAGMALTFAAVGALAILVPALRATAVDPVIALRAE